MVGEVGKAFRAMARSLLMGGRRPRGSASVALLAVLTVAVSACTQVPTRPSSDTGRTLDVVASTNFYGSIVSQIGGDRVNVTSIISDPEADPHLYESSAENAAAIAKADVIIVNGAGYDDFMNRLISASGTKATVVDVQQVIGATSAEVNPHFWYDIPRMPAVAKAIEAALSDVDPADKAEFEANRAGFERSLGRVQGVIASIRSTYPGAPVAYTERVAGYLIAAAGLTDVTPPGFPSAIESGNEPSPADAQKLFTLMEEGKIKVLLYNDQAVSPVTQNVLSRAKKEGVPIVAVSETLQRGDRTYQAWQLRQAQDILTALGR